MKNIHSFLGVSPCEATFVPGWGADKLDKRPLSVAIKNYTELEKHFGQYLS